MSQAPFPAIPAPNDRGPMTIGQVLERTFRIVSGNFWLFVAIGAVPFVAFLVTVVGIQAIIFFPFLRPSLKPPMPEHLAHLIDPFTILPSIAIAMVVNVVVYAFYLAAATRAATQSNLGMPVSISDAWQSAWKRIDSYIWLLVLMYAVTFFPALMVEIATIGGIILLMVGHAGFNPAVILLAPLGMLLFVGAMVYGMLMMLRLALAFPASVVEELPAIASLKRSNTLTQGAKGRMFIVLLVIYAACYGFVMVFIVVLSLLGFLCSLAGLVLHTSLLSPLGFTAIGFLGFFALLGFLLYISLYLAGFTTSLVVIYQDQRLRNDHPPLASPQAGALA